MKAFTINELENIFEIGRAMQLMADEGEIEIEDSKNAFLFAAKLAMEFEEKYCDTEDYYGDLDEFIRDKILEELKVEI
jgi:hypothetical protein